MAKFSHHTKQSAKNQAKSVAIALNNHTESLGTNRNYQACLSNVATWIKEEAPHIRHLKELSISDAINYLEYRGQIVGQKTLDMERLAMQTMLKHVSQSLGEKDKLPCIKSELSEVSNSRFYLETQFERITQSQTNKYALASKLAYHSGLRAHELYTLMPLSMREADNRPTSSKKWQGRNGTLYTVKGKGGLIREVLIPSSLADELEKTRLSSPITVSDRKISYLTHYDLGGGHNWSSSFTAASKRSLGWSRGGHGLRHSYAQNRMRELRKSGLPRAEALEVISQEMGHFRPNITEVYLR